MAQENASIVVIGSGPSGAMAARTLVEHGLPVTMLESGQDVPSGLLVRAMGRNVLRRRQHIEASADVSTDRSNAWYQALVPGGLSNYWVGAAPRFAPDDFCEGERLDERYRWPLSYADLQPYYDRAERVLRIVASPHDVPNLPAPVVLQSRELPGAWQAVARHAATMGHGLAPMPLADGPDWMVTRTGVGFNSYTHVVRPLQRRDNFELRLGAHVLRLEWQGDLKKVTSVLYRDRASGRDVCLPAAAVVVAGGSLASTKLLLNSDSHDFPNGLGNGEGLLGQYLHEHPQQWFQLELRDAALPRLPHAAYLTRAGVTADSPPLMAAGCTIGFASLQDKLWSIVPRPADRFGVLVFGTMVPLASNQLRVHPVNRDEFGLPQLDAQIAYAPEELHNMSVARERLANVLDAAGYPCSVPRFLPDPEPGNSVHYGGTVRMHASAKHGMLNGWNRLHAVDNVVVADASSFTTGVEKNPTLTAMALAARAADRLARDLKAA
jgi:choline dehydrogenase-like flavoprotein